MKSSRNKKFITDILIYGVGNLGSKMITFLLVPLYTYFIDRKDFGYYDLILNIIFLAIPFVTIQLRDGVFRFLLDNEKKEFRTKVISFTYSMFLRSIPITLILCIFLSFYISIPHFYLILGTLVVMSYYEVQMQIVRGLGKNKYFVIAGIITSLFIGLFSILFVVELSMGIAGIFVANISARIISLFVIEFKLCIWKKYYRHRSQDKELNKQLINYTLPLLPNIICWWLIGSSNRFFIANFLGFDANGIYAVAIKFSTILETLTVIIYQAWQETAIKQYNSHDKNEFYSKIFNLYLLLLVTVGTYFAFILKFCYRWIIDTNYGEGTIYLFPMFISVIFYALSSFLDIGYQCSKQTNRILPSIMFTAILNLLLNYLFIRLWGINGIIVSSIISYTFLLIYRFIDSNRYFKITISNKSIYLLIILSINCTIYYLIKSILLQIIYLIFLIIPLYYLIDQGLKLKLYSICVKLVNKIKMRNKH